VILRATPEFRRAYESLGNRELRAVNAAVERLMVEHEAAWAREGRVEGDRGGAWLFSVRSGDTALAVYWDYVGEETLTLLLLLRCA
jgi:hypothetical protein